MTLTVVQQYPINPDEEGAKSLRLNHPDWGDVNKTTYVKGVITAFEQVQDDPIQVAPRVKVRVGDGAESGFIPLFFHPKEKYWDDAENNILATAFNEEQGHFNLAWQSFRVDDEVAVMLKEGVPIAVMGFADGVPRIGEDIFQMEYKNFAGVSRIYQWQPSANVIGEGKGYPYGDFNIENKGPDGLGLGLKTPGLIVCDTGKQENIISGSTSTWYQIYPTFENIENITTTTYTLKRQFKEVMFIIGPKAYLMQILNYDLHSVRTLSAEGVDVIDAYPPDYHHILTGGFDVHTYGNYVAIYEKLFDGTLIAAAQALGATHQSLPVVDSVVLPSWVQNYTCDQYIAPINPSFPLDDDTGKRGPDWEGWNFLPDLSLRMSTSYLNEYDNTSEDQLDLDTLEIFTRPHTKQELQEAGMWPHEGS